MTTKELWPKNPKRCSARSFADKKKILLCKYTVCFTVAQFYEGEDWYKTVRTYSPVSHQCFDAINNCSCMCPHNYFPLVS